MACLGELGGDAEGGLGGGKLRGAQPQDAAQQAGVGRGDKAVLAPESQESVLLRAMSISHCGQSKVLAPTSAIIMVPKGSETWLATTSPLSRTLLDFRAINMQHNRGPENCAPHLIICGRITREDLPRHDACARTGGGVG